jgi:DNA polymerase delta subunit 4
MATRISEHFRQKKPHGSVREPSPQKARRPAEAAPVSGANAGPRSAAHDDDLSPEERLLRQFDLDTKYGPCIGMTRLER